jgi:hypothetical protein
MSAYTFKLYADKLTPQNIIYLKNYKRIPTNNNSPQVWEKINAFYYTLSCSQ